jgi:hypothetical protein
VAVEPEGGPEARIRRRAAVLVGLVIVVVTFLGHDAASSSHAGGDSAWTTYQSLSVLEEGNLELSEWQDVLDRFPIHWYRNDKGEPVFTFPWGTAVVSAPIVGVLALRDAVAGRSLEDNLRRNFAPHEVENTVASTWVALTTGLLFALAYRELGSVPGAALLALTFAFATSAFSTMSRALWAHAPAVFLVTLELLILQAAGRCRRAERLVPLLGPLFVLAYAVRPTTAVVAVVLGVVVGVRHRRQLPAFLAAGAVAGLGYLAVNLSTYGSLQPGYYDPNRLFGSHTFFEGLAGNLVSPQRGLLVWSPVLLFAAVGVVVALRRGTLGLLQGAAVAAIVLHWLVISTLVPWYAGFSTGPRLFSDVLPFFVLLMVPAVAELGRGGRAPARWFGMGTFAVLLGWSVFTNTRGAIRFETQLWNSTPVSIHDDESRLWDWSDLQFLR